MSEDNTTQHIDIEIEEFSVLYFYRYQQFVSVKLGHGSRCDEDFSFTRTPAHCKGKWSYCFCTHPLGIIRLESVLIAIEVSLGRGRVWRMILHKGQSGRFIDYYC